MTRTSAFEVTGYGQAELVPVAAEIFHLTPRELSDWRINYVGEGRLVNAYAPLDALNVDGATNDPRNTEHLKDLMAEYQLDTGSGTGQRDPGVVGHVPGEAFYVEDGFHRYDAQRLRGQSHLLVSIEPDRTFEQVVARRIEYARAHPAVEFARQVEWMQSVWQRTPWSHTIPNVLTAFRAFRNDYAIYDTPDIEQIDALDDEAHAAIRQWVREQSHEWGYTPKEIQANLSKVESFSPELMQYVYQKKGQPPEGRIGLTHVQVITDTYPGEFDMQEVIVDLVRRNKLTPEQTRVLIDRLEESSPITGSDLEKAAKVVDFLDLRASVRRSIGHNVVRNVRVQQTLNAGNLLEAMLKALPQLERSALDDGAWTPIDRQRALTISTTLAEILAQLVKRQTSSK